MNKIYEKNFERFEAKKRDKLGDKLFLEKYTRVFRRTDKLMKILLPILLILNPINVIMRIAFYVNENSLFELSMLILWSFSTLVWVFVAILYYTHRFKFHSKRIVEWQEELRNLNNSETQIQ